MDSSEAVSYVEIGCQMNDASIVPIPAACRRAMLEQGIQAPSLAPDLIRSQHQPRTYIAIGTSDGGASAQPKEG
jgi:hypothetical protein